MIIILLLYLGLFGCNLMGMIIFLHLIRLIKMNVLQITENILFMIFIKVNH